MAFVVSDPCIGVTDMSCVEICPVSCIYTVGTDPEHPDQPFMVVIDAEECIDCGMCEPECPVEAITMEENVPEKWQAFIAVNALHNEFPSDNDGPNEEGRDSKEKIAEAAREAHAKLAAA